MTFRVRVLLALLAVAIIPLGVLGVAIRQRVSTSLEHQFEQRVRASVDVIRRDVDRQTSMVADRLRAVGDGMQADNRFRQALLRPGTDRSYAVDYAERVMRQSGLSMLQVQDEGGRIVSSGHFRNEYDLPDAALPAVLRRVPGNSAIAQVRMPDQPFLALVRLDSVAIGARRLTLVGGLRVDPRSFGTLEAADDLSVTVVLPGDTLAPAPPDGAVVSELTVPFVQTRIGEDADVGTARVVVAHSLASLDALRRSLDVWFVSAIGLSVLVAALFAFQLASRMSRPLARLADQTDEVELDRLDVSFAGTRHDEIGQLARTLDGMTQRLRASVRTLREAERRAALGDLARQINHDIKNGLIPIRNVFRHLSEVARDDPMQLADVYRERQRTVETAIDYLEKLAATYAGLSPQLDVVSCDVNALVGAVVRGFSPSPAAAVQLELDASSPRARVDALALRRVVENLVSNAVESLPSEGGRVVVTTKTGHSESGQAVVQLSVADSGKGMTADELDRAFGDFYTTKSQGTGLGLSIVRRLVRDLGGSVRVVTEPGSGTQFLLEFPQAEESV